MFKALKNSNFGKERQGKYFLYFIIIALAVSAVSFLLLLEKYKQYDSEISIIFVPKSEIAARDAERIIENMEILPTKMFFYDRMAAYDKDIENKISSFSDVKVEREKNSSVMKISALAKGREDSIAVSKTVTTTLFNVLGFYYNIKKDADFRIVDGPITHVVITNWIFILVYGLLAGILSLFVISFISQSIFSYPERKKKASNLFKISQKIKAKPEISKIREEDEVYEIKASPKTIPASTKQSSAPENLPFIDEDYFRNNIIKSAEPEPEIFEEIVEIEEPTEIAKETTPSASVSADAEATADKKAMTDKKTVADKEEPVDFHREPTQEELKKRLNQLLRGEL